MIDILEQEALGVSLDLLEKDVEAFFDQAKSALEEKEGSALESGKKRGQPLKVEF